MQPSLGFGGLYTSQFSRNRFPGGKCHRSKGHYLRQTSEKGTRRPFLLRTIASLDEPEKTIDEHLHDTRPDFEHYYESSGSRSVVAFLRQSRPVSKMFDDNSLNPSSPSMDSLSGGGKYYRQAIRLLYESQRSESGGCDTDKERLLHQPRVFGPVKRRNAFFLGIPHKYLRAHQAFHALPTSTNVHIETLESLTSLRQDCEPFLAAWKALTLHADEVWPLLGFGEENLVSKLLPPRCRGHTHALKAWQRLFSPTTRRRKRTFYQLFQHEHVSNASLSYIIGEQTRWLQMARNALPSCEAVQLLETGCHVSNVGFISLAAAPVARVVRRSENDFWMWGPIDTILIAKIEQMFSLSSTFECRLRRSGVRRELDLLSWIEAQFSMLSCGEKIRFADVVWYSTLGGSSVFRVKRDDIFLEAGLKALERFLVQFVEKGCPPHTGFERGDLFRRMAERITKRSTTIERRSYENADVVETRIMPWRQRLNDWEENRSQKPFF